MTTRLPETLRRGLTQANVLLSLLETGDSARLEGLWGHVATTRQKATLSACLQALATEAIAGLPPTERMAAAARQAELQAATARSANAMQHAARIYIQARHVIEVLTELHPDKATRLRAYRRGF